MSPEIAIRCVEPSDVEAVLELIRSLATYENRRSSVTASVDDIHALLFGDRPAAEAILAEVHGQPVGFALFYHTISSFAGRLGLYLEDLYVEEAQRGQGIGKLLLQYLAQIALDRKCNRLEWCVLKWNDPAIEFYRSLGSRELSDWAHYDISGAALQRLASES